MKKIIFMFAILALASCKPEQTTHSKETTSQMNTDNPLLQKSTLDYGAPDFSKIKDAHFEPAIDKGMALQNEAIKKIVDNADAPTFENTIVALEESSTTLDRVTNVFHGLTGFHTNPTLKKLDEDLAPKFSKHQDDILLNTALFKKVKAIHDQLGTLKLDTESDYLVKETYKNFVKAGANLSEDQKNELKKINSELASLSNKFSQNLLDASKKGGLSIDDAAKLKGLTAEKTKSYEKDGKHYIQLLNTTQQPDLQNLEDRETRKGLFEKSIHRTDQGTYNTSELIQKIVTLRAQKAEILGFENFASWSLQGTMASKPARIFDMFNSLVPNALEKAALEKKEIQDNINKGGESFELEAYDWNHYAEKVRKAKYDLDESEIKPYFELHKVLEDGVFFAATELYGITFKKRTDIPTYHPDVLVYELFEEDGTKLGLFYGDFYARDTKNGGAWMSAFVKQSSLRKQKPVIYNICNFPKPADGEPALISFDEAETMFHEFGHALHGFFGDQKYYSLSGTSVARDFVEFPSQFNENWMTHPKVLNNFATHYKTGERIPQTLLDKIEAAGTFNQGYSILENLAASNLDMQWHTIGTKQKVSDVAAFEADALAKMKLKIKEIPPRYRSTFFAHIFASGYAAGYYSYLWTEMLSHDAYDWFEHNGSLSRKNGQKFRDEVLSRGNTMDYLEMYKTFTSREPQAEPMLKARGLKK